MKEISEQQLADNMLKLMEAQKQGRESFDKVFVQLFPEEQLPPSTDE